MRQSIQRSDGAHGRGISGAAVAVSKPPRSTCLWRIAEGPATPDVARTDLVGRRKGASEVYDAVDLRLIDTFPASAGRTLLK
jgi:hypothetical protein